MNTYRSYRNEVTKQIRLAKITHCDKLPNNLKSNNLNSKDWWKTIGKVMEKKSINTSSTSFLETKRSLVYNLVSYKATQLLTNLLVSMTPSARLWMKVKK